MVCPFQVREGRIRAVGAKEAVELTTSEGWVMLDVRPPEEIEKVRFLSHSCLPFPARASVDVSAPIHSVTARHDSSLLCLCPHQGSVKGAVQVPVFVVDNEPSFMNLIKQATAFGMGELPLEPATSAPRTFVLFERLLRPHHV